MNGQESSDDPLSRPLVPRTHKAAINKHLEAVGIPVSYTNVFWGGRSEITPSEISPIVYKEFHEKYGEA